MYISKLEWDDYRVEHIAEHDVVPHEVWEVCNDDSHLLAVKDAIVILFMDRPWMDDIYLLY